MTKVNEGHLFIYLRARKKAETRAKNWKEAAVVMQADKGRRQGRGGTEKTARKKGGREERNGEAKPRRTDAGGGKHDARTGKGGRAEGGCSGLFTGEMVELWW